MTMEHKNAYLPLIEDQSNAFGPSGFEDDVLAVETVCALTPEDLHAF